MSSARLVKKQDIAPDPRAKLPDQEGLTLDLRSDLLGTAEVMAESMAEVTKATALQYSKIRYRSFQGRTPEDTEVQGPDT
jgi:hypothetical protein